MLLWKFLCMIIFEDCSVRTTENIEYIIPRKNQYGNGWGNIRHICRQMLIMPMQYSSKRRLSNGLEMYMRQTLGMFI